MEYAAQENYNQAEREYETAKEKFFTAKTAYELEWAKAWDLIKTKTLGEGIKLTEADMKYKLLIQQNDFDHPLGKAFVALGIARAEKGLKLVAMNEAERDYWNSKDGSM